MGSCSLIPWGRDTEEQHIYGGKFRYAAITAAPEPRRMELCVHRALRMRERTHLCCHGWRKEILQVTEGH